MEEISDNLYNPWQKQKDCFATLAITLLLSTYSLTRDP